MRYDPDARNRRLIRLPGWDYRNPGAYFITVCTFEHESTLVDPRLQRIVRQVWRSVMAISGRRGDAFVVMPNHIHGIVWITGSTREASRFPLADAPSRAAVSKGSLGAIVRSFKSVSARRINERHGAPGSPVWQRGYYEHIVRNEADLARVRRYIAENPSRWKDDPENPVNWTNAVCRG